MDWFKKHADTVIVLAALFSGFLWVNGKFTDIHNDLTEIRLQVDRIKTVLILQKIMPVELAHSGKLDEKMEKK